MCSTVADNYLLEIAQDKLETVRNMSITKDESYVYDLDPKTKPHEEKTEHNNVGVLESGISLEKACSFQMGIL